MERCRPLQFENRTNRLTEQYNAYEPLPGQHVNGELTLGENIGDLGGTAIALRAYEMSLDGEESPVIDGLTGRERFFLGMAQAWRSKYRDEAIERRLKTDPHSPPYYRVNGVVRNIDAFYDTFSGCGWRRNVSAAGGTSKNLALTICTHALR